MSLITNFKPNQITYPKGHRIERKPLKGQKSLYKGEGRRAFLEIKDIKVLQSDLKEYQNKITGFQGWLEKTRDKIRKLSDFPMSPKIKRKIESLEKQICTRVKALYKESVKIHLQALHAKKTISPENRQNIIHKCTTFRTYIKGIWDKRVESNLKLEKTTSNEKRWECYEDNWIYWMEQPELPSGIKEDFAFAVVSEDGTFDPNYPIFVPPWSTDATLAIGGWNNSQSTQPDWGSNGFYQLIESMPANQGDPASQLEPNFLQAISTSLNQGDGAWTSICLDFENYGDELATTPQKYTQLVTDVYNYLKDNHPGVGLKMCISPNVKNRRYFDMQQLLATCPDLQFQVMCYDYALGQTDPVRVIPNDPIKGPSGEEAIDGDLDYLINTDKVPQNRIYLGVPEYGVIYNLDNCSSSQEALEKINNNWSLTANPNTPYGSSNGQITNEDILSQLGGDWSPSEESEWETLVDNWGKTYYYHQQKQQIIVATPPDSLNDLMGNMVKNKYPNVLGFFGWEAIGDNVGSSVKTFKDQFEANSSKISNLTKIFRRCFHWLRHIFDFFKFTFGLAKIQTGAEFAKQMQANQSSSDSCYIDMGILYGDWVYTNAMIWWPEPVSIDQEKVDTFLDSFFDQLKKDGVSDLRYSFEQMCDIFKIMNNEQGVWTDTISLIYSDDYKVGDTGKNFLEYMSDYAVREKFTNTLSFGGALASGEEMILPDDGKTCSDTLIEFMNKTNIQSVDFDIEGSEALSEMNDPNNLEFFQSLKQAQVQRGGFSTITVVGDINQLPSSISDNFDSYFDKVSLMLYSNTQYYLNAEGNYTWALDNWIKAVGNDPSKISIGFYDQIAYENPSSNAGTEAYDVDDLSRGQSAAKIYIQVAEDLGISIEDFASPFWWTDDPTTLSSNTILEDFYNYLGNYAFKSVVNEKLTSHPFYQKSVKFIGKNSFPMSNELIKEYFIQLGRQLSHKKVASLTSKNSSKRPKILPWKQGSRKSRFKDRTFYHPPYNPEAFNSQGFPKIHTNANMPRFMSNDPKASAPPKEAV